MKFPPITACLLVLIASCGGNEEPFTCTTNTKVESFGENKCFVGTAYFTEGRDAAGTIYEEFDLTFADPNGGTSVEVYVTSRPYQPPFTSTGNLMVGTTYTVAASHAHMYIDNLIMLVSGSIVFSKINRTARTLSGTVEFTYTINNSQGNQDTTFRAEFTDVNY